MAGKLRPGDRVRCIRNRLETTLPPVGLVVGRAYRVEATGLTAPDDKHPSVPWVRVSGVRVRDGKQGFRASWFELEPERQLEMAGLAALKAQPMEGE